MKIVINIEADSVEEAKSAFAQLAGESVVAAQAEKPTPATRKKTEKETPSAPKVDPAPETVPSADPLADAGSVKQVADPLAASAPAPVAADPLASAPATITLQTIREKIGTLTDQKQAVKDIVATYKKADDSPCEKPSDLQEKDYAAVLEDLNFI